MKLARLVAGRTTGLGGSQAQQSAQLMSSSPQSASILFLTHASRLLQTLLRRKSKHLPLTAARAGAKACRSPSPPTMDSLGSKMMLLTPFPKKHKVTVVGSGNWYSAWLRMVLDSTDVSKGFHHFKGRRRKHRRSSRSLRTRGPDVGLRGGNDTAHRLEAL